MSPRLQGAPALPGEGLLLRVYAALATLWMLASWWTHDAPKVWVDVGWDLAFVTVSAAAIHGLLRHSLRQKAESSRLLQTLADHSPDAIYAKDRDGRYTFLNRAAAAMTGADRDSVLGHDDRAPCPAGFEALRARDLQIMASGHAQTFEEEVPTASGPRTFVSTKGPLRDGTGISGLFGIARDITEMVNARQQLQKSEQRYRLATTGGYVWDWDMRAQQSSSQTVFWQRLGYDSPLQAEVKQRLLEVMHPDDRETWQAALRSHLVFRKPYELEFRARHRNGQWHWFRTQGQAIWDEHGRATYMAGTTFDVTDRRRIEEALLRTQSELSYLNQRQMDQERETTLRMAQWLHDRLGQSLGGARLHLDLALDRMVDEASIERMQRVSSLLDDAIGEVRRVLVDLRPPLLQEQGLAAALDNEIRRGAAESLEVAVWLDASPQTAAMRWPEAVEHAAFMIAREGLANALRHARAGEVRLSLCGDSDHLELRVDDDGQGIADGDHQARPGHLGLVGMRERAASIGATLGVKRRASGGTRVRLRWSANVV